MFYSTELLSLKRNGRFAKCWLAATLSRGAFHTKMRRTTIESIDVAETCDELISYINSSCCSRKLSLHLSSQLMFGVTTIWNYQTKLSLDRLWKSYNNMNSLLQAVANEGQDDRRKATRNQPDVSMDLTQLPPVPLVTAIVSSTMVADESRITLQEDPIYREQELVRQDADLNNFGALTADQMDRMFATGGSIFAPEASDVCDLRCVPEEGSVPIDLPDSEKPAVIPNGENNQETELNALSNIPSFDELQHLTVSTTIAEVHEPATPTKRKPSPITDMGTPTKLRRGLNDEFVPPLAPNPIPPAIVVESPQLQRRSIQSSSATPVSDIVLATPELETGRVRKHRKFMDELPQLSQPSKNPHRQNTFYETRHTWAKDDITVLPVCPDWLTTPSSKPAWGRSLSALYRSRAVTTVAPEYPTQESGRRVPRTIVSSPQELRSELRSHINPDAQPRGELYPDRLNVSTTLGDEQGSIQTSVLEPPRLPQLQELPIPEDFPVQPEPEILEHGGQSNAGSEEWPEERYVIATVAVEVPPSVDVVQQSSFSHASPPSDTGNITAMLEVQWSEKRVVEFRDICPPSTCTKLIAAQTFGFLLKLHKTKMVKLKQAEPFSPIYIEKYSLLS